MDSIRVRILLRCDIKTLVEASVAARLDKAQEPMRAVIIVALRSLDEDRDIYNEGARALASAIWVTQTLPLTVPMNVSTWWTLADLSIVQDRPYSSFLASRGSWGRGGAPARTARGDWFRVNGGGGSLRLPARAGYGK